MNMQTPVLAVRQLNSRLAQMVSWRGAAVWVVSLLVFGGLCVLYGSTVALDYTTANDGADGGDLLAAILTGGVPHPSGYPAYLLLGKLFQILPVPGSPYLKGALLSLVFAAGSAGLIAAYFHRIEPALTAGASSAGAFAAGIALGTAPLLWSQAVIVEVYGLQAFFTAGVLLGIVLLVHDRENSPKRDAGLFSCAVLGGLSLGNHLTILLMVPALAVGVGMALRKGTSWGRLAKFGLLVLSTAVLVYLVLPLRARLNPPVNWGDPQTLDGLAWLVSGSLYQQAVFAIPPDGWLPRLSAWAGLLVRQSGYPGLLLAIFGGVRSFLERSPFRWILVLVFAAYTIFSIGYDTNDSLVYLIPALMVFSIWIGIAVVHLAPVRLGSVRAGWICAGLFIFYLLLRVPGASQAVNPRADAAVRTMALDALCALPPNAVVVTNGDSAIFALWYYHLGLKQRPDLSVIAAGLAAYPWYNRVLASSDPTGLRLPAPGAADWQARLARLNPDRPICGFEIPGQGDSLHLECQYAGGQAFSARCVSGK